MSAPWEALLFLTAWIGGTLAILALYDWRRKRP